MRISVYLLKCPNPQTLHQIPFLIYPTTWNSLTWRPYSLTTTEARFVAPQAATTELLVAGLAQWYNLCSKHHTSPPSRWSVLKEHPHEHLRKILYTQRNQELQPTQRQTHHLPQHDLWYPPWHGHTSTDSKFWKMQHAPANKGTRRSITFSTNAPY